MALGYWRGETVPFHRVWTTDSGNDATGTTVTLTLGGPLGQVVLPTVSGIAGPIITVDAEYQIPDDAGAVGLWSARWELAGTIVEAAEDIFYVKRSLTNANDPGSGLVGTPALQLLAALLTVDGPGSLLDADKLDGLDSTAFATPASTTAAVAAHVAAADPHADRAFATSAIATAIANLINAAPGTLDTLNELALALGSDPNFATTITNALAGKQPLDSDLTAIAALSTTSFGRALLVLVDAPAGRTALGLGTASTNATGDFQPVDSDLTAIAALTTTAYGRAFLALADAAAARTALALGTAAVAATTDFATAAQGTTADNAIAKATLTVNANLLTRTAGVPAEVTRANLAADAAFTGAFAPITVTGHTAQVDVYTVAMGATTWNKPSWAVAVDIHCIGGGGGGGSGRKGAAGTVRCGGGGAGAAAMSSTTWAASDLPSTLTATAGAGGVGGAARTVSDTDGANGGVGTVSTVKNGTVFYASSPGGNLGFGGTNATGAAGGASIGMFPGGQGGAASTTGLIGNVGLNNIAGGGAGSGGGITTGDASSAGGPGGFCLVRHSQNQPTGGAAGAPGQVGTITGPAPTSSIQGSHGAGGGGSSTVGNAGDGGAGGFPGGAAGGGGAALNAVGNSGAGGAGGAGLIVIITRG